MGEIKLTPSQQAVIENEGGTLLVSAAAGSGKTKVLVDRLLRKIMDPVRPYHIDDFLIITYTKAAASELRAKISAELSKKAALHPENRHLQKQLRRIYQTKISTIHAFCSDLLRSYGHIRDISPDFRVAEEAETRLLRQRVKEKILDQLYLDKQEDPDLQALLMQLGYGRDDRNLEQILFTIYDRVQSYRNPAQWLDWCYQMLTEIPEQAAEKTLWGASLLEEMKLFLSTQRAQLEKDLALAQEDLVLQKAYVPTLSENLLQLDHLMACDTWDEMVHNRPTSFGRLSSARKCSDPELMERIKADRSRCWEGLKQRYSYFYGSSQEVLQDLRQSSSGLKGAIRLTQLFSDAYQKEKARKKVLDFNDLEHQCLALLLQKGTDLPSALAKEVSAQFAEIMVDEYQDSNEVQDQIFSAISQDGHNLFFVGDMKQSIYRFRMADPRIFLKKYQTFLPASAAKDGQPRKILLSENFRSRKEILSGINQVFQTVMSVQVGDMAYSEAEQLKPGLSWPPISEPAIELHCIAFAGSSEEEGADKVRTEAKFIAKRIASMLREEKLQTLQGERQIQPGDVAILLRSVSNTASVYLSELKAFGIPAVSDKAQSILDTKEAEIFLALLQIVENPHQDIPLITALASPVFAFQADELAKLRMGNRSVDLYTALTQYRAPSQADPLAFKTTQFIKVLEELRRKSLWFSVGELVEEILHVTMFPEILGAMEGGSEKVETLQTLVQLACGYAVEEGATLLGLVEYLQGLRDAGIHVVAQDAQQSNSVKIMSIHKSKGLEFPVVVLPDLSRKFNETDLTQEVLLHQKLGLGGNFFDAHSRFKFPTIAKKAIALEAQQENRSEELRILYVAMTRAKERLVLSYCSRYLETELKAIVPEVSFPAPVMLTSRAKSPGSWILMAALCRSEANALFALGGQPKALWTFDDPWKICTHTYDSIWNDAIQEEVGVVTSSEISSQIPSPTDLEKCLSFQYPYAQATQIPAKLTATQLKGRVLDGEAEAGAMPLTKQKVWRNRPAFSRREALSPTQKGTATHLFLQFATYSSCTTPADIEAEKRRLVEKLFLTPEQAEAVQTESILNLFSGELGHRILQAPQIIREWKFSCLVPSELLYPQVTGEEIMLQGVVDCFLIEDDGICVIDFKTDFVTPETVEQRARYYARQVEAYGLALEKMYHLPVKEKILYFFHLDQAICL